MTRTRSLRNKANWSRRPRVDIRTFQHATRHCTKLDAEHRPRAPVRRRRRSTERLAVQETARCIAILEAIDRDLDQRGLVDKEGTPRYLLNHRSRTSRQLEQWLEKVSTAIERKAASEPAPLRADFPDYVRALQRIALGHDASATTRDRLVALKELRELGPRGTTSYLERPAEADWTRRWHAVFEARRMRDLERDERSLGITD